MATDATSHMSPKYAKSPVGWLTSETSAVVCLGLAQTGRWGQSPHTSKKLNAVAMTTAVDHGKMVKKKIIFRSVDGIFGADLDL